MSLARCRRGPGAVEVVIIEPTQVVALGRRRGQVRHGTGIEGVDVRVDRGRALVEVHQLITRQAIHVQEDQQFRPGVDRCGGAGVPGGSER